MVSMVVSFCAPLLSNFGESQLRLYYLRCLVLLCCFVALLQESLGLARKTRHLRLVLRRREEGCLHDGGIDAIINITDRPPPQPPPPLPLRKPLLATFIIIIIGRRIVYLQSAGVVNTHTLTVVGTRSRFALLRGELPQLQSQF